MTFILYFHVCLVFLYFYCPPNLLKMCILSPSPPNALTPSLPHSLPAFTASLTPHNNQVCFKATHSLNEASQCYQNL